MALAVVRKIALFGPMYNRLGPKSHRSSPGGKLADRGISNLSLWSELAEFQAVSLEVRPDNATVHRSGPKYYGANSKTKGTKLIVSPPFALRLSGPVKLDEARD
jgi:hypothetical protein